MGKKVSRHTKTTAKKNATTNTKKTQTSKVTKKIQAKLTERKRTADAAKKAAAKFSAWAVAKAKESGLLPEDMVQLGMTSVSEKDSAALGLSRNGAGIRIPYFGLDGEEKEMCRYRYEVTEPESGFLKGVKLPKYLQPSGTDTEVYFPRIGGANWPEIVKDATKPLVITEGELKAACVTKEGAFKPAKFVEEVLFCIGLGGVWSFGNKKLNQPLLPVLRDDFEWQGRRVYICYDSDAVTNPDVNAAENRFARLLADKRAQVHVVRIPRDGEKKVGADDFVVKHGIKAFRKLLEETPQWNEFEELYELSARYAVIRSTSQIFEYETGRLIKLTDFVKVNEAERKLTINTESNKTKTISAAAYWVEWKPRPKYEALTYVPGQGRVTEGVTEDCCLNLWRPSEIEPHEGDIAPYLELLEHLIPNPDEQRWFEQWAAYPLQTHDRNNTAVVVWGEKEGTGKTKLGETIGLLHGKHNYKDVKQSAFESDFTDWQECKTFIMGSEVSGEKGARDLADKMKSYITGETIWVNRKHQQPYELPNAVNYYLTSNHDNAVFIGQHTRRYGVFHAAAPPLPAKFYKDFVRWRDNGGLGALLHRMLTLDLSGYNAKGDAPHTEAREEMIAANRSPLQEWVHELRTNTDSALAVGRVTVPGAFFTAEELLSIFAKGEPTKVTATGLGRVLRVAGFKKANGGVQIRIPKTDLRPYLWVIRDELKAANMTAAEVGEAYARRLSGTDRLRRA